MTGYTLLCTQDILELLFLKCPQLCIPFSTHTPLCGKYPELILDIHLSLRFKLRLEYWLLQALDKFAELYWGEPCLHLCKVTQDKLTAGR